MRHDIQALKACRSGHAYSGFTLSELPIYLAIDDNDQVALFIPASDNCQPQQVSTSLLSLQLAGTFSLTIRGACLPNQRFHMLKCKSTDTLIQDTFIVLSEALANQVTSVSAAAHEISSFFDALTQLFKTVPTGNLSLERQGLWGELFVLRMSGATAALAQHWHSEPSRKFDFSVGAHRLEVKTTVGPQRVHSFSHHQLFTADEKDIVVASMMLRPDDAGLTLQELITEVRGALSSDVQCLVKLERAIRRAGMTEGDTGPSFDAADAQANLAWFGIRDIPRFAHPEPPGVSNTRYEVDLSTVPALTAGEVAAWLNPWLAQHNAG